MFDAIINEAAAKIQSPFKQEAPIEPQKISEEVANNIQVEIKLDTEAPLDLDVKAPEVEQPPVQEPDDDLPLAPAAENFKKLRNALKETRAAKRELEQKATEFEVELERYKKGEKVPEVVSAKDQRIQELEKYEKLFNLKMSKEYQQEFVEPSIQLGKKLQEHASTYNLPPEVINRAVELTGKELNQFLSNHFDDLGALEAKKIINEIQDIGEKALKAEQEPETIMQELKTKFEQHQQEEAKKTNSVFENTAKTAWQKALEKRAKEGAYKELVIDPNNPEFNKKVVEPIQAKASQNFGALLTQLRKNGLQQLPEELAVGLASLNQLAVAGALLLEEKAKLEAKLNEVMKTSRVVNPLIRPSVNGSGVPRSTPSVSPKTPQEAAAIAAQRLFRS